MSDATILGFDTSAAHCAAALLVRGEIVETRLEHLARGQGERLMPLLQEMLAERDMGWGDLSGLAVGIGPGNFTGVRIAVSAARGLALGLGIPALGVSLFEVMADGAQTALVSLEGPRGTAYLQAMRDGRALAPPVQVDPGALPGDLGAAPGGCVIGHAAAPIAAALGATARPATLCDIAPRIARIAAARMARQDPQARPAPLYVRPADAAPPRDAPPLILP